MNAAAIYADGKSKKSDGTKTLVQKMICPEQLKLHVRELRIIRNGGVIINKETKNYTERLKQTMQLTKSGFKMDEPYKCRRLQISVW